MSEVIKIADHPQNADKSARIVATTDKGTVYQTSAGYVAVVLYPWCMPGTYATIEEAQAAMQWPIDSCTVCQRNYWACKCGASPLGYDPEQPPAQCDNIHCHTRKDSEYYDGDTAPFRFVQHRFCCKSFSHHYGQVCKHCGVKN